MLTLAGAGGALQFRLGAHLAQLFPPERVRLEAKRLSVWGVDAEPKPITDQAVEALRTRDDVENVFTVEPVRFPVRAEGNLFGETISTDVVVHGVERELIEDALADNIKWQPPLSVDDPIPTVFSRYFLDLYNLGYARAQGLQLLNEKLVLGRHFTLVLNESTLRMDDPSRPTARYQCVLVGMTSQPAMLGMAIPADLVRVFNRNLASDPIAKYAQLVVTLREDANREAFLAAAGGLGLKLSGEDVFGNQLRQGVRLAGWALIGLAGGVFGLGLMSFYLLFAMVFHARRLDLIRLRALGVSARQAVALALAEVGGLAVVAVGLALVAQWLLNGWAARTTAPLLEQLVSLPADLFAPATGWLVAAGGLILVVALLPALPMLWWVVRVEPAEVIRDL